MDLGLKDKVAIVTGASSGLGFAAARALSEEGVRTVLGARTQARLELVADELPSPTAVVPADLRAPDAADRLVGCALKRFGRLDILVASGGGPPPGSALDASDEQLRDALDVHFVAVVRLVRAAVAPMVERGWGRVCIVASSSVHQPIDDLMLSNAARPALWGWAKTLADELLEDGVTVTMLCPGAHATARAEELKVDRRRRLGDPEDFGRIAAFLCSAHTGFVTGTTVVVDGGMVRGL